MNFNHFHCHWGGNIFPRLRLFVSVLEILAAFIINDRELSYRFWKPFIKLASAFAILTRSETNLEQVLWLVDKKVAQNDIPCTCFMIRFHQKNVQASARVSARSWCSCFLHFLLRQGSIHCEKGALVIARVSTFVLASPVWKPTFTFFLLFST